MAILDVLAAGGSPGERLRLIVHGWLALVVAVALDWIEQPRLAAAEIRDRCVDALTGALAVGERQE